MQRWSRHVAGLANTRFTQGRKQQGQTRAADALRQAASSSPSRAPAASRQRATRIVAGRADCCLAAEQGCGKTVKVRQLWFQAQPDPTLSFLPHMGSPNQLAAAPASALPLPQHAAQLLPGFLSARRSHWSAVVSTTAATPTCPPSQQAQRYCIRRRLGQATSQPDREWRSRAACSRLPFLQAQASACALPWPNPATQRPQHCFRYPSRPGLWPTAQCSWTRTTAGWPGCRPATLPWGSVVSLCWLPYNSSPQLQCRLQCSTTAACTPERGGLDDFISL